MLITVTRVARILDKSERTVRSMAARGALPCTRTESGMRLFDRDVIEHIAAARTAPKSNDPFESDEVGAP